MGLTVPTGRTPHELVEVAPTRCPNGHPLGADQVLIGMGSHPDGGHRRRWTCRLRDTVIWDER
jgi:hypothetical protein